MPSNKSNIKVNTFPEIVCDSCRVTFRDELICAVVKNTPGFCLLTELKKIPVLHC